MIRVGLAIAGLLGGCQAKAVAQSDEPEKRFEHDMITRYHMRASYDLVRAIERLLIAGKLDEARALARSLAAEVDAPGLEPWARQVALVRTRAAAVAAATSLVDVTSTLRKPISGAGAAPPTSHTMTRAPSRAKRTAVSRPMPAAPPVTIATRPSNLPIAAS